MTADDKKKPDQSSANAPDDGQSDNSKKQSDGGRGCLLYSIIALVLLPILYFLSSGPVAIIFMKSGDMLPKSIVNILQYIYYPLIWLVKHNETFAYIYLTYIFWWCDVFGIPIDV